VGRSNKPVRASQRPVVSINLAEQALKQMMVEQCRVNGNYLTVYHGARADLVAAGVPDAAFPDGSKRRDFQVQTVNVCCTGSRELLDGAIRPLATGYELEVNWGYVRPYVQGNHPAVAELARMLLRDIMEWAGWDEDLQRPIDMVAADPRAVDYKPGPGAPRLRVTPEFHRKLQALANQAYEMVQTHCEVCASETAQVVPSRPAARASLTVVGSKAIEATP